MKSYTDIEQSKKLAEILPLDSADMYYKYVLPKSDMISYVPEIGNPVDSLKWYNEGYTFRGKREPITLNEYCVPCWSLAALLGVLPKICYPVKQDYPTYLTLGKPKDKWCALYWDATGMQDGEQTLADNPVDACVEMIIKLHDQKLL